MLAALTILRYAVLDPSSIYHPLLDFLARWEEAELYLRILCGKGSISVGWSYRPWMGTGRQTRTCYTLWLSKLQPTHVISRSGDFWPQSSSPYHHPSPGLCHLCRDCCPASAQSSMSTVAPCRLCTSKRVSKGTSVPVTPSPHRATGLFSNALLPSLLSGLQNHSHPPGYPVASH